MQGRGLKLKLVSGNPRFISVAPYAGAWIETLRPFLFSPSLEVAPYAGAWIETFRGRPSPGFELSPLMQGRGLKPKSRRL